MHPSVSEPDEQIQRVGRLDPVAELAPIHVLEIVLGHLINHGRVPRIHGARDVAMVRVKRPNAKLHRPGILTHERGFLLRCVYQQVKEVRNLPKLLVNSYLNRFAVHPFHGFEVQLSFVAEVKEQQPLTHSRLSGNLLR